MIYGGFDPSFIDIDTRPITSNNQLLQNLPSLGSHWTKTDVEFIPGGNGFNFCRTLASLGEETVYVGPVNDFYRSLVNKLNLKKLSLHPIPNATVNYTVILNLKEGEVQFNSIKSELKPSYLTQELVDMYFVSPIKMISNIALNPSSIEWITSLVLSAIDRKNELITDDHVDINEKFKYIEGSEIEGILFIDPSHISSYTKLLEFYRFLLKLKTVKGNKLISLNEYEVKSICAIDNISAQSFSEKSGLDLIVHTKDKVNFYSEKSGKISFPTKKLSRVVTFVGAGDVFNASTAYLLVHGESITKALEFGIDCATKLIETGKYSFYE